MKPNYGDIVQVNLIVLKLFGLISWSWLWVLSPFWIGIVILSLLWCAGVYDRKG